MPDRGCRNCGMGIAEHAMGDAYLPDLSRCPEYQEKRARCLGMGVPPCDQHVVQCTLLEDHPGPHFFAMEWDDPKLDGSEG